MSNPNQNFLKNESKLTIWKVSSTYLLLYVLSVFFQSLSFLSPVLSILGVQMSCLGQYLVSLVCNIHHGMGLHDSGKNCSQIKFFSTTLGKPCQNYGRAKMEIPLCSAVIKNHEILGPLKLSAAYHYLSGGYLAYIQSPLNCQQRTTSVAHQDALQQELA